MGNETKIANLDRKLDIKRTLLARATDKGNKDLIERINVETRSLEQELKNTLEGV